MFIGNLVVVLIIACCCAYQYLKGTLVKAFAATITAICASILAFAYFELLGGLIMSQLSAIVPWAQPLSFALLFIVVYAILQILVAQVMRRKIDLGVLPERIGRVVFGIFLGLILSGLLLTVLAMAPLRTNYPYQRFDSINPDAENPNKVLFSADGFATGWFNLASKGSLSGKRSFAVLHANFVDQAFLNRHKVSDGVPITTSVQAIELPRKQPGQEKALAAWFAPAGLKGSNDKPIRAKSGHALTIVRIGIKRNALSDAGRFIGAQLRLICKQEGYAKNPLAGSAKSTWPIGYLETADKLHEIRLDEIINVSSSDFESSTTARYIDFAFYVPNGYVPVLVQFKQNAVVAVPPMAQGDEVPPAVPFSPKTSSGEK
ncbi:MAG: CvpA family protein [Planctomycetota bacterium]|jgi:hypothetical protein